MNEQPRFILETRSSSGARNAVQFTHTRSLTQVRAFVLSWQMYSTGGSGRDRQTLKREGMKHQGRSPPNKVRSGRPDHVSLRTRARPKDGRDACQ